MTFQEAEQHIERWYRYGDREIAVPVLVFVAYCSGMTTASRFTAKPTRVDKFGRVFLAYKNARVYFA